VLAGALFCSPHVGVAQRFMHRALPAPARRKQHQAARRDCNALAAVAAVLGVAGNEMAQLVARDREPPAAGGADPQAGLGRVVCALVQQAATRLRAAFERAALGAP